MGFLDSIRGGSSDDEPAEDQLDDDDPLMDDDDPFLSDGTGSLEMDDAEDDFEDPFGDEMGWDDEDDDDAFDASSGPETAVTEDLESRVSDVEREITDLSSTMETVRTENQQIGESVEGIEDNVRKLLGVYEMVTRGINPFVDDEPMESDVLSMDGSMSHTHQLGDLSDLAPGDTTADEHEPVEPPNEEAGADTVAEDDAVDEGTAGDTPEDSKKQEGKSFSDLESAFDGELWDDTDEPGDEEFDVDDGDIELDFGSDTEPEPDPDPDPDPEAQSKLEPQTTPETEPTEQAAEHTEQEQDVITGFEWGPHEAPQTRHDPAGGTNGPYPSPSASFLRNAGTPTTQPVGNGTYHEEAISPSSASEEKPFLTNLSDGYSTEMLVLEWLEYLLTQADYSHAKAAVDYYETLEWISAPVADQLHAYLKGLGHQQSDPQPDRGRLTSRDHVRSLKYISRLSSPNPGVVVLHPRTAGRGG